MADDRKEIKPLTQESLIEYILNLFKNAKGLTLDKLNGLLKMHYADVSAQNLETQPAKFKRLDEIKEMLPTAFNLVLKQIRDGVTMTLGELKEYKKQLLKIWEYTKQEYNLLTKKQKE